MEVDEKTLDPQEVLTGEKLARLAAADFESFFHPDGNVLVKIVVEPAHSACIRGTGANARIVITPDMASEVIVGPDRLHLHLLIIGHEIAHLVHRHLEETPDPADNQALEYWADFYGAKVMMALVTFGTHISSIYMKYYPEERFHGATQSIGNAIGTMIEGVYNTNKKYPAPLARAGLTANGVMSFLRRFMLANNVDILWMLSAMMRLLSADQTKRLMNTDPTQIDDLFTPLERVRLWHLNRQNLHPPIEQWLHPAILPFLTTRFTESDSEIALSTAERREELRRLAEAMGEPELFDDD